MSHLDLMLRYFVMSADHAVLAVRERARKDSFPVTAAYATQVAVEAAIRAALANKWLVIAPDIEKKMNTGYKPTLYSDPHFERAMIEND